MTKKSLNKLLSIILTIAICLSTVLGCLITANAADDVCCAVWSDGTTSKELDFATAKLTLNAVSEVEAEGFTTAYFELGTSDTMMLSAVAAESATLAEDGTALTDDDLKGVAVEFENGYVIIDYSERLSTITLKVTFSFDGGYAKQGNVYNISVSKVQLSDGYNEHNCEKTASFDIKASCDHVIAVKGNPINTDSINGYTVYAESYCTLCGEKFGYQLVPSTEPVNGITIYWDGTDDAELIDPEDGEQKGTADSPIIINSVEELHYLATAAGREKTYNNYYKIADGITTIVLQPSDIADDDEFNAIKTAGDAKTYFSTGTHKDWSENTSTKVDKAFAGHFDGNGVTIVGLYSSKPNTNAPIGLFPVVHTGKINATMDATITNIYTPYTVENPAAAALTSGEKFVRNNEYDRVTISGVNITKSYAYGTTYMGFVVGCGVSDLTYKEDYWVDIKNCSVYNSYMESRYTDTSTVIMNGLLAGYGAGNSVKRYYQKDANTVSSETAWLAHCGMTYDNCLVYGNTTVANDANGDAYDYGIGAMGNTSMGVQNIFTNSIVLGTTPYLSTATVNGESHSGYSSHRSVPDRFKNVYTDASLEAKYYNPNNKTTKEYDYGTGEEDGKVNNNYINRITQIAAASVLGYNAVSACPDLAWGSTWSYGADGEYPSIISGTPSVIYWDGTEDTDLNDAEHGLQDGTKAHPIIIDSAEELYAIAVKTEHGPTIDEVKHYKIADGIDTIVLQPYDTIAEMGGLDRLTSLTGDEVKAYFDEMKAKGIEPSNWCKTNSKIFNANFYGNNVEIYGLYGVGGNVGLFPQIDGGVQRYDYIYRTWNNSKNAWEDANGKADDIGVTIENFAIRGSYFEAIAESNNTNYRVGAVSGIAYGTGYGPKVGGVISMNNIEVSNCYMYSGKNLSGSQGVLLGSNGSDWVKANKCLVYGNVTADLSNTPFKLFGQATAPSTVNGKLLTCELTNSIILGTEASANSESTHLVNKNYLENVYTDKAVSADGLTENDIKVLASASDAIGSAAKTAMPNLAWGTDWYANIGGYPTLTALDETRVNTTSNGAFGLTAYNTAYNNDGSFDFNFYFNAQEGYDYKLYVGKTDSKSGYTPFLSISPVEVNNQEIIEQLGENAMVATIPRLSARDVNTVWVPTLVATNGAVTEWGQSKQIALADYANGVLNDKVVYSDDVTDDIKLADKKVAAALLNYADAATKALEAENDAPASKNKIVYYTDGWGVKPELLDPNNPNSKDNPYIIDTAEKLLYIVHKTATEVGVATEKQYYKVPDDIKAFVLQSKDRVDKAGGIDELMNLDAEGVMKWFDDPNKTATYTTDGGFTGHTISNTINVNGNNIAWKSFDNSTSSSTPFMGEFDGNGVTIYGYYSKNSNSLFGTLKGATIKNVNIKSSYVAGFGGALIAHGATGGSMDIRNTIENCTVSNSCVVTSRQPAAQPHQTAGVMVGNMSKAALSINNCVVNDVIAYNYGVDRTDGADPKSAVALSDTYYYSENGWKAKGNTLSVLGGFNNNEANHISNVVALGLYLHASPYDNWTEHGGKLACFSNCYTDMPTTAEKGLAFANNSAINYTEAQIKQITDLESLRGANAAATLSLDFDSNWMITSGYPQPVQSGYTSNEGKTLYWSGERATSFSSTAPGTKEEPIIIYTAEELAYLAYADLDVTTNGSDNGYSPKYFEIADGIDKIVLQPQKYADDIISLTSLDKVKDYFVENGSELKQWTDKAFKNYAGGFFGGNFDGKGVEIYGMYSNPTNKHAALFPCVDGNASISNVSIINSYNDVLGDQSYGAAGIIANIAYLSSQGDKSANNVVSLDNCKIVNSYFSAAHNASGNAAVLVARSALAALRINNCLVYGSESWHVSQKTNVLVGVCSNNVDYTQLPDYLKESIPTEHTHDNKVMNMVMNSVLIDVTPIPGNGVALRYGQPDCNTNVYTNIDIDEKCTVNNKDYTDDKITDELDLKTFKGSAAADIVSALNAANNKEVWYVGAAGDYPGFEKADAIPNWLQVEYDTNTFTKFNDYSGGKEELRLKNAGFNLGANPYMSFVFGFDGAYKTDRQNIKIYIDYTLDGNKYITKEVSVPAFTEGAALSEGGWLSKATSTNHTYEFTDLPIKAFMHDIKVYAEYTGEAADKVAKTQIGTVSAEGLVNAFINASKKKPCNFNAASAEAAKALFFYVEMVNARYAQL